MEPQPHNTSDHSDALREEALALSGMDALVQAIVRRGGADNGVRSAWAALPSRRWLAQALRRGAPPADPS